MEMAQPEIESLSRRLSAQPESPLFARLADLYLSAGDPRASEALALCERGVRVHPSYASGYIVLGKCLSGMGRVREARSAYHQALELAPYNTVVQNLLISLPDVKEEEAAETIAAADEAAVAAAAHEAVIDAPEPPLPEPHLNSPEPVPMALETEIPPPPVTEQHFVEPAPEELVHESDEIMPQLTTEDASPAQKSQEPETDFIESLPVPPPSSTAPPAAAAEGAEAAEPEFEPYPTFEEYIAQHPTPESVMTLEEYLKGRVPAPSPSASSFSAPPASAAPAPSQASAARPESPTDFESIALRLQSAGRIVPAEPASASSPASAPSDAASGTQSSTIVTQTMAEIYAAQNEFQAAIDAYEELIKKQPEQAKVFQQRIDAIRLLMGTV